MMQLILYTSEDGHAQVQLRADRGTVWLTQLEMAELFNASKQNISLHLKNIYQDGELDPAATVKESLTVQTEGARDVRRSVTLYNLDAILAVGYAVTQQTAVELVLSRANPADAHFGLLTWKGERVRKQDILIAKNYLTEDEIDTLNRLQEVVDAAAFYRR
ncbi:MAG: virulence RhuM family protein [Magnetococcus sp. DMHC-1]